MRRFFNLKFLVALVLGAGVVAALSVLSSARDFDGDDESDELAYGEPDGEVSSGEVSSFVD